MTTHHTDIPITADYASTADSGGKAQHLDILKRNGIPVPLQFAVSQLHTAPDDILYAVRSSEAGEDGLERTLAGKNVTLLGVRKSDLQEAIATVRSGYATGSVVVQEDLSNKLSHSGVLYTNLNGELRISGGDGSAVQGIVRGIPPSFEYSSAAGRGAFTHGSCPPHIIESARVIAHDVETLLGVPTDVEFGVLRDGQPVVLQARPLPNYTDRALREHARRQAERSVGHMMYEGASEYVLGIGNYREILGNDKATPLSVSLFSSVFSGDGVKFGATQLGRNELGYSIGTEIHPWTVMVGGSVYYNFVGDALQFRPEGFSLEEYMNVINDVYLPRVRENPALLNYAELGLYVQSAAAARSLGIREEPFSRLEKRLHESMREVSHPLHPPTRERARDFRSFESSLEGLDDIVNVIRHGSAKEYIIAARLAFFALEELRERLAEMKNDNRALYSRLATLFDQSDPTRLRDSIAYDESIESFSPPQTEEYGYLGSFELSSPRGFAPVRAFKKGKYLIDRDFQESVELVRYVLAHREKVKFALFRDYDLMRQTVLRMRDLSGCGDGLFDLPYEELGLARESTLVDYRSSILRASRARSIVEGPLFSSVSIESPSHNTEAKPTVVFGRLDGPLDDLVTGRTVAVISSVDQTVTIPPETKVVIVQDNIRPGSHLFTVLSDYGIPVIGLSERMLKNLPERFGLAPRGDDVDIIRD